MTRTWWINWDHPWLRWIWAWLLIVVVCASFGCERRDMPLDIVPLEDKPAAVEAEPFVIDVWTGPNCVWCEKWKRDAGQIEVDGDWVDDPNHPVHVIVSGRRVDWQNGRKKKPKAKPDAVPAFSWKMANGDGWHHYGWPGLEEFVAEVERTVRLSKAPVTFTPVKLKDAP